MEEFKTREGKPFTIKENDFPKLAGDVVIDIDGNEEPGILLGGGLSGCIAYPESINDPTSPVNVDIPAGAFGDATTLAGSIVSPRVLDDGLLTAIEIMNIIEVLKKKLKEDSEFLDEVLKILEEKYVWNMDYMKDNSISNAEKLGNVDSVVTDNLETIRNATIQYQGDLDKEDAKGNTL